MSRIDEDEDIAPRALVARKLSLRVSGARAGAAARPAPSGASAAGAVVRASDPYASTPDAPRRGLRVHARGTTPPPIATAAPRVESEAADEPYPWEVSS